MRGTSKREEKRKREEEKKRRSKKAKKKEEGRKEKKDKNGCIKNANPIPLEEVRTSTGREKDRQVSHRAYSFEKWVTCRCLSALCPLSLFFAFCLLPMPLATLHLRFARTL